IKADVVIAVVPTAIIALEKSGIATASRRVPQQKVCQPQTRYRSIEGKYAWGVERRVEACRTQKIACSESELMRSLQHIQILRNKRVRPRRVFCCVRTAATDGESTVDGDLCLASRQVTHVGSQCVPGCEIVGDFWNIGPGHRRAERADYFGAD